MSRYLFVCDAGCVRSHAMTVAMKRQGHEAMNAGRHNLSGESLAYFCEWADYVVITAENQRTSIPAAFNAKLKLANIGHDRWGIGFEDGGWLARANPGLYEVAEHWVGVLLAK